MCQVMSIRFVLRLICGKAESVSHHLGVPVLHHASLKPSYSCIRSIRTYFASLPKPIPDSALVIIGDRIFTDIVLAKRMRNYRQHGTFLSRTSKGSTEDVEKSSLLSEHQQHTVGGPLSVLTTRLWKKESTIMRFFERKLSDVAGRWAKPEDILSDAKRREYLRETA